MLLLLFCFFFFNDTATTEIYTLSLHDALPISDRAPQEARLGGAALVARRRRRRARLGRAPRDVAARRPVRRSEEHTSELQSLTQLVCRLLLEKKKTETTSVKTPCYTSFTDRHG